MDEEIRINDLVVAPEVVETLVRLSAEKVDGVAAVGVPADINGVFSLFSSKKAEPAAPAVQIAVKEGGLAITLRLSVLFGYPFVSLADQVREAVASMVSSQVGAQVLSVDVYIDSLLFPKE